MDSGPGGLVNYYTKERDFKCTLKSLIPLLHIWFRKLTCLEETIKKKIIQKQKHKDYDRHHEPI